MLERVDDQRAQHHRRQRRQRADAERGRVRAEQAGERGHSPQPSGGRRGMPAAREAAEAAGRRAGAGARTSVHESAPALKAGAAVADEERWSAPASAPGRAMTIRTRHHAAPAAVAIAAVMLLLFCATATAARTISPLPPSDYGVRAVCAAPARGQAGCLALQLVPLTAAARAHTRPLGAPRAAPTPATTPVRAGEIGLRPQDLHSAYALPDTATAAQTIAIVDAYNDPHAEADLKAYDEEFGLPECTAADGCFEQLNQSGKATPLPFPKSDTELESARNGSSGERKRPNARPAGTSRSRSTSRPRTRSARTAASSCSRVKPRPTRTSKPPSAAPSTRRRRDLQLVGRARGRRDAGAGEDERLQRPRRRDHRLRRGRRVPRLGRRKRRRTRLHRLPRLLPPRRRRRRHATGNSKPTERGPERASGTATAPAAAAAARCSKHSSGSRTSQASGSRLPAPARRVRHRRRRRPLHRRRRPRQQLRLQLRIRRRHHHGQLPDWCTIGGTSLASPLIASVFALAGGADGAPYPARTLYQNAQATPSALHDVTAGSNGACSQPFQIETGLSGCTFAEEAKQSCDSRRICLAADGFDGPSGLGTPDGIAGFERTAADGGRRRNAAAGSRRTRRTGRRTGARNARRRRRSSPARGARPGQRRVGEVRRRRRRHDLSSAPGTTSAPTAIDATVGMALSSLALTQTAALALNASRPRVAALDFRFTLNRPDEVRVTLSRRVHSHGRASFSQLHGAFSFARRRRTRQPPAARQRRAQPRGPTA